MQETPLKDFTIYFQVCIQIDVHSNSYESEEGNL